MKKLALGILAAVLSAMSAAHAADMATKAPPLAAGYPTKCGVYYGINAEGGAGVVPNAPAGTTVIGGDIGVLVGYACVAASTPWFAEAIFDFQNLNAGNNGFSLSGPFHGEGRVGIQTSLIPFMASLWPGLNTGTAPSLPVLPPQYSVVGTPANYVYGAVDVDDISSQFGLATAHQWLVSPEVGTGILFNLVSTNKTVIVADTYAGVELQSNSLCLGANMCPKLGTRYKTGVSFKY